MELVLLGDELVFRRIVCPDRPGRLQRIEEQGINGYWADEWMTTAEIAEETGTADSGWRIKAGRGEIPAVRKGYTWLIRRSDLRKAGVDV